MILELILSLLPGFLITLLFFKKESVLIKTILVILINIILLTFLGIFFGFNEFTYMITGGLTKNNLIIAYSIIDIILFFTYIIKTNLKNKFFSKK